MTQNHTLETSGDGVGFTPGEWEAQSGGELMHQSERLIVSTLGFTKSGIREIRTIARTFGNAGLSESLANAKLIAAAPTMFSALRRICEATPGSTNSATIAEFQSWIGAVAGTALADALGSDPQPIPIEGGEGSSVAGLPAHAADATATDTNSKTGKEG